MSDIIGRRQLLEFIDCMLYSLYVTQFCYTELLADTQTHNARACDVTQHAKLLHSGGAFSQGRSQKFVLWWYKFLLHNTAVQYTSSLTSSAAISAQHNFQGLILEGYIYRYTPPPSLRPCVERAALRGACVKKC